MTIQQKHKHVMGVEVKEKVPLYDVKLIGQKQNRVLVGYDLITSKVCDCGLKEPTTHERQLLHGVGAKL